MILAMSPANTFLLAWIAFAVLSLMMISAVLIWAARNGQFADQERARWLPLRSRIPAEAAPDRALHERKDGHVSS